MDPLATFSALTALVALAFALRSFVREKALEARWEGKIEAMRLCRVDDLRGEVLGRLTQMEAEWQATEQTVRRATSRLNQAARRQNSQEEKEPTPFSEPPEPEELTEEQRLEALRKRISNANTKGQLHIGAPRSARRVC